MKVEKRCGTCPFPQPPSDPPPPPKSDLRETKQTVGKPMTKTEDSHKSEWVTTTAASSTFKRIFKKALFDENAPRTEALEIEAVSMYIPHLPKPVSNDPSVNIRHLLTYLESKELYVDLI
jgi:hypothetical protein